MSKPRRSQRVCFLLVSLPPHYSLSARLIVINFCTCIEMDVRSGSSKVRKHVLLLKDFLSGENTRVRYADLLKACHNIEASTVFPSQGWFFQYFFECYASLSDTEVLGRELEESHKLGRNHVSLKFETEMVRKYRSTFCFHVVCTTHLVSQKCTGQLYFANLVASWRGLSMNGMDLFATTKTLLPSRTFRSMRADHHDRVAESSRQLAKNFVDNPYVAWIDNYSKVFRATILRHETGGYPKCLWTGFGVTTLRQTAQSAAQPPINLEVQFDATSRSPIPSFPETLFRDEWIAKLAKQIAAACSSFERFDRAFCTVSNVYSTPIHYAIHSATADSELALHLENNRFTIGPLRACHTIATQLWRKRLTCRSTSHCARIVLGNS